MAMALPRRLVTGCLFLLLSASSVLASVKRGSRGPPDSVAETSPHYYQQQHRRILNSEIPTTLTRDAPTSNVPATSTLSEAAYQLALELLTVLLNDPTLSRLVTSNFPTSNIPASNVPATSTPSEAAYQLALELLAVFLNDPRLSRLITRAGAGNVDLPQLGNTLGNGGGVSVGQGSGSSSESGGSRASESSMQSKASRSSQASLSSMASRRSRANRKQNLA
ncbi:hypothetical protein CLOM_g24626 [Closterium sp. NIES-68]|nr:hypothetical protein CLOM_g24626 [Closterium sp. NIES-68]